MTQDHHFLSQIKKELEDELDNTIASAESIRTTIRKSEELLESLERTIGDKRAKLLALEYNGWWPVNDCSGHSLTIGDKIAVVQGRRSRRMEEEDRLPRYSKKYFRTIFKLSRVNNNGVNLNRVDFITDGGERKWKKSENLKFVEKQKR